MSKENPGRAGADTLPSAARAREPGVSVVIPNYNGAEYLDGCLTSLWEQDYPLDQLEVLVVDNGSTDDSAALVRRKFPQVRVIRNETNLGFSKAANQGAEAARKDLVAFLNTDMRVERGWLVALAGAIKQDPTLGCVGSLVMNWDGTAVQYFGRGNDVFDFQGLTAANPLSPIHAGERRPYVWFASGGAMLVRAEVFSELGGFDPDYFLYHEDVDLGWRLWLRGYKCALTAESVVYHRGAASSSRLPSEFVMGLRQRAAMETAFKNLAPQNLERYMPVLMYLLLEEGTWFPAAVKALPRAMDEFQCSLGELIQKRAELLAVRTIPDQEIFTNFGEPFHDVLRFRGAESVSDQLAAYRLQSPADISDVSTAQRAFLAWLNAAHSVRMERREARMLLVERSLPFRAWQVYRRSIERLLPPGSMRRRAYDRVAIALRTGLK